MDIIDHICKNYSLDLDSLHAHMANHCTEDNNKKHLHWKPPKGSALPPSNVHHTMAAKSDIDLNGIKYLIKKANSVGQPMDVAINGITYSVSMALVTYHVSALQQSAKSGLLVDRGANGGIVGEDCHILQLILTTSKVLITTL